MTQTFTIDAKLPSLNDWIRATNRNRFVGAKMKREAEEAIGWNIKRAGVKPVSGKIALTFEWHERTQKRDKDNVASAKKFILDAMRETGVLTDDGNRFVEGFKDEFVYDGTQRVKVTIEEETDMTERKKQTAALRELVETAYRGAMRLKVEDRDAGNAGARESEELASVLARAYTVAAMLDEEEGDE